MQTYITQKITAYISERIGTPVQIGSVSFEFFDKLKINDLLVIDQQQDTLLYAELVDVHISNWFFLSEKPIIYKVALEDAKVNLLRSRKSDQWNYQYLIDAFPADTTAVKEKAPLPSLDLKQIVLKNVDFNYKDAWIGTDYEVRVGKFILSAQSVDLQKGILALHSIDGENIDIGIIEYTGGRPYRKRIPKIRDYRKSTPFNPDNWEISVEQLSLLKSRFFITYPDIPIPKDFFDDRHLDVTNINTEISNISIVGDTIKGKIERLTAQDRSGLAIRDMRSDVTVSPNISECKNLYLKTDNSELTHYYAMHYNHFPDFLDYIEKVKMVGKFSASKIGVNDILYFTDAIERVRNHSVFLSGIAEGTVSHLQSDKITVFDGENKFEGDISLIGIPETETMRILSQNARIIGTGNGALKYLPELKNNKNIALEQLGYVKIEGGFEGILDNFDTKANIQTSIGSLDFNANLQQAFSGKVAYKGNLNLTEFNLGALLRQNILGPTTMQNSFAGIGLLEPEGGITFESKLEQLHFNKYDYKNILVNATYLNQSFKGSASSMDSNFNFVVHNGELYFANKKAHYNFDAQINYINTQALHFTRNKIHGSAELNFNFTGDNLDNFLGSAIVYNMQLQEGNTPLQLQQFYLNSSVTNDKKNISFVTNGIQAKMNGIFTIADLPQTITNYLSTYIPEYVDKKEIAQSEQNFNFSIATTQSDDLFKILNLPIRIEPHLNITGSFDSQNDAILVNGNIPGINVADWNAKNLVLLAKGDNKGLDINVDMEDFNYSSYELASKLKLTSNIYDNKGSFNIKTESINTLGDANISGKIFSTNDSFFVQINPSNLFFNNKKWEIESQYPIAFAQEYFSLKNIQLSNNYQKIILNQNNIAPNQVTIDLQRFEVSPINNMIGNTDYLVNGYLYGEVKFRDIFDQQILDYQLNIDTLYLDDITIGAVKFNGNLKLAAEELEVYPTSYIEHKATKITFNTLLRYSEDAPSLGGNISFDETPLNWIQPFTKGYIHDLEGYFNGNFKLEGSLNNPVLDGKLSILDASVTPDITGVKYYIAPNTIETRNNQFYINNLQVRDTAHNIANLNGTIMYDGWFDYVFNLKLNSDKIQVLNLSKFDNEYFYGNITAKTSVTLTGLVDNIRMNIIGTPLKGSKLYIPINSTGDYSAYEYIKFKRPLQEKSTVRNNRIYDYNLRIDAIATPDLEAFILLDESTGDQLQAIGRGNLVLEMPSNGDMTLTGNYIIEEGKYNFAIKQLEVFNYKKQFTINSGSVIKWSGNIYDAELDVNAYTTVKARLYDLIMNEYERVGLTSTEISDAQVIQPINVNLNMVGALSKPELKFNIGVVESRSFGSYAYQKLQRINNNERELLNQVTGLLLLNQFLPPEGMTSGSTNASLSAGAITNMSEVFSTVASSQLSNFANKLFGSEDLYIGLKYKNYALSGYDPNNPTAYTNRNEAGFNLRKNFFNNRLVTEVGGIYDWGNSNSNTSNYNLAGEFRLQYLLTKDGRIRLNAFRNSYYNPVFQQNVGRQGAGILFRKSFSNFKDLFQSQSKPKTIIEQSIDSIQQNN